MVSTCVCICLPSTSSVSTACCPALELMVPGWCGPIGQVINTVVMMMKARGTTLDTSVRAAASRPSTALSTRERAPEANSNSSTQHQDFIFNKVCQEQTLNKEQYQTVLSKPSEAGFYLLASSPIPMGFPPWLSWDVGSVYVSGNVSKLERFIWIMQEQLNSMFFVTMNNRCIIHAN